MRIRCLTSLVALSLGCGFAPQVFQSQSVASGDPDAGPLPQSAVLVPVPALEVGAMLAATPVAISTASDGSGQPAYWQASVAMPTDGPQFWVEWAVQVTGTSRAELGPDRETIPVATGQAIDLEPGSVAFSWQPPQAGIYQFQLQAATSGIELTPVHVVLQVSQD